MTCMAKTEIPSHPQYQNTASMHTLFFWKRYFEYCGIIQWMLFQNLSSLHGIRCTLWSYAVCWVYHCVTNYILQVRRSVSRTTWYHACSFWDQITRKYGQLEVHDCEVCATYTLFVILQTIAWLIPMLILRNHISLRTSLRLVAIITCSTYIMYLKQYADR